MDSYCDHLTNIDLRQSEPISKTGAMYIINILACINCVAAQSGFASVAYSVTESIRLLHNMARTSFEAFIYEYMVMHPLYYNSTIMENLFYLQQGLT